MFTIQLLVYDTINLFPAKAGVTQCLNGTMSFFPANAGCGKSKCTDFPFFVIIVLKVAAKRRYGLGPRGSVLFFCLKSGYNLSANVQDSQSIYTLYTM